jgi:hypothetical protein
LPDVGERFLLWFWDLSTERQLGMMPGPIPVSRIWEFADRKGLDPDAARVFEIVIRILDNAYLERKREEFERERKSQQGQAGVQAPPVERTSAWKNKRRG